MEVGAIGYCAWAKGEAKLPLAMEAIFRVCDYVLDRYYIPQPDYCRRTPVDVRMKDRRWRKGFLWAHDVRLDRIGRQTRRRKGKDRAAVAKRSANAEGMRNEEFISWRRVLLDDSDFPQKAQKRKSLG